MIKNSINRQLIAISIKMSRVQGNDGIFAGPPTGLGVAFVVQFQLWPHQMLYMMFGIQMSAKQDNLK